MKWDMAKPCADCPFRSDKVFPLMPGRAEEILDSIIDMQQTFPCHKTVDYSDEEDEYEGDCHISGSDEQHCAGATIFLEKLECPNQMMRIAERLGLYDHTKLDMDAPVWDSREEMEEATSEASRR